jgi:hypothetical protein
MSDEELLQMAERLVRHPQTAEQSIAASTLVIARHTIPPKANDNRVPPKRPEPNPPEKIY